MPDDFFKKLPKFGRINYATAEVQFAAIFYFFRESNVITKTGSGRSRVSFAKDTTSNNSDNDSICRIVFASEPEVQVFSIRISCVDLSSC